MSSVETPSRQPAENEMLLSQEAADSGKQRPLPQAPMVQGLSYAGHVLRVTLCGSYANLLLVFVPLGIIAGAQEWDPSAVFIINFLAIFPLASVLSFATEELAKSVGQTVGGMVNATFGNAVEMIVGELLCYQLLSMQY
jgi:hypothetical protein